MGLVPRALALWCAVAVLACDRSHAYTVDCNHEYTDCDTELTKTVNEDDELSLSSVSPAKVTITTTTTPKVTTPKIDVIVNKTDSEIVTEPIEVAEPKPKPRLLNLNVDELQNFANALHNQSNQKSTKKGLDLSDVNLDDDEDDSPRIAPDQKHKNIPDKFYANLQAPFHHLLSNDRGSEELEACKENGISYKAGDVMNRGCEETCECTAGGTFDCLPRCKPPYIRRGRRLDDPLCFESPVDDCCSIVACATGNGDTKANKLEVCRYGNETYTVGTKWHIGCEQICSCEPNSNVTCKPRCNSVSLSEKCINVQDPNDACCEIQVCDVSQDVHEEPADMNATSTTTTTAPTTEVTMTTDEPKDLRTTMRPLVLVEPIGSIKVLHNNSVQVNLMHVNNSEDPIHLLLSSDGGKSYEDIELKYSNLILNLEGGKDYILKTKETGTKFNFTITPTDPENEKRLIEDQKNLTKVGCYQDGIFYGVGEEFHIGCTELCECTGPDTRECAALACPSHVGLELVSKGCVRWEQSPPAHPPNCCPRTARCLSDGTCHYNGVAIPNWSEVPISLTGCEQRCFCENGDLDCQEVCSPLLEIPPHNFRCPPLHHPAPVNISDEDCCKQWGCVPNARNSGSGFKTYSMPMLGEANINYVTPVPPITAAMSTSDLHIPITTDLIDFYRHLTPVKSFPKQLKPVYPISLTSNAPQGTLKKPTKSGENITVFALNDVDSPFKPIQAEPPLDKTGEYWNMQSETPLSRDSMYPLNPKEKDLNSVNPFQSQKLGHLLFDSKTHNIHSSRMHLNKKVSVGPFEMSSKNHEIIRKVPISQVDHLDLFLPNHSHRKPSAEVPFSTFDINSKSYTGAYPNKKSQDYFNPTLETKIYTPSSVMSSPKSYAYLSNNPMPVSRKQITVMRNKNLKPVKPSSKILQNKSLWNQDSKTHVLMKAPNPYETVLYRVMPNTRANLMPAVNQNVKTPQLATKTYSSLDLEHLLSQMEVESEVNRNLERSADKNQDSADQTKPSDIPSREKHPKQPPFLPTVPPEIHYPPEDVADYDENNIHHPRPINPLEPGLPNLPGLAIPPNFPDVNKKLTVISLEADSPTSVKMLFGLPPVLVGLRGSVDLRYTDQDDEDISQWYSQVFAPEDEILTTSRLDFRLTGLKPSTTYKIRGKLYLHNLPVEPESDVYSVRTQDPSSIEGPKAEEKRREINSKLTVVNVNDTSAHIAWRHFTEDELKYIDGIQVRYRPVGTPIYSMTELLHHSRSAAELHDLHPGSVYEASLVLIPPPHATTELYDPGQVEFTTLPFIDPYNWTVVVEARKIGSEAVELTWRGVPSPAERWVRVYRAAHACGSPAAVGTRQEHDAFRLAARDLPPTVTLTGLEPDSRCQVWLELFLTNGKIKTTNVLEINTKSLDSPQPVDNEIEAASVAGGRGSPRGDYYGALVVVGVIAALGALTSVLLLLVVVRRHRPRSVAITSVPTAPRESSLPPYDNPAYKLELQQETMDL